MSALIQSKTVRLALLVPGDNSPKWNMIFPAGYTMYRGDMPGGSCTYDAEFFASILKNWKRMDEESRKVGGEGLRLPVDYFHRGESLVPNDTLPAEEKVASGWIIELKVEPSGLWGLIDWTERARKMILADELAGLSPSFHPDAPNKWDGGTQGPTLYGAGLLNDPFLTQMPRVAASNTPPKTAPAATTPKEKHMDKKQICAMLGLAEDSADDVVMQAIHALKNPPAPPAPAPAPAPPPAAVAQAALMSARAEKLELANKELSDVATKLSARVQALETEKQDVEVKHLCEELVNARRILPTGTEAVVKMCKALGIDEGRKYFSALPVMAIPTNVVGIDSNGVEAPEEKARQEQEAALIKQGRTPAEAKRAVIMANPKLVTGKPLPKA